MWKTLMSSNNNNNNNNNNVAVIPLVIGALDTVTKRLIQGPEDLEIRGQVEIIKTTALLRSARILRRVLKTCCHSSSWGKQSANAGVINYLISEIMSECRKLPQRGYKALIRLCEKGDPLGIVQEIEIWPINQLAYAQTRVCPRELDEWNSRGFRDTEIN